MVTGIWLLFGKFRMTVQDLHALYPCLLTCNMCQSWCSSWVIPHLSCVYFNTRAVGGTMSPIDTYVRILSLRVVRFGARASGVIRFGWSHEVGTFIKSDKVTEKTFQATSPSWPMSYGKVSLCQLERVLMGSPPAWQAKLRLQSPRKMKIHFLGLLPLRFMPYSPKWGQSF